MILVTGASGHLGQRVLHHLLDTLGVPANRIVAASRHPEKLGDRTARGVTTRKLDFENSSTFSAAFSDVERALLISTDALDRPGRRLEQHRLAIDGMAAAGVKHVIYTSMPRPENSPLLLAPDHLGTEQALAASSLAGWTVLRNHWYFENLFMFLKPVLAAGKWFTADNGQASADIARDDLARAAATVLASGQKGKQVCTLSGAQALTKRDIAGRVSAMTGKPIEVVQVPLERLVQGMVAGGMPEPLARMFASFDTNTAAGRVTEVTDDYRRITGIAPMFFDDWLATNKDAFTAG